MSREANRSAFQTSVGVANVGRNACDGIRREPANVCFFSKRANPLLQSFSDTVEQKLNERLFWEGYVRDQMGHRSIQVTVDIDGHAVPGGNRAAVDRLDDAPLTAPNVTPAAPSGADEDRANALSAIQW